MLIIILTTVKILGQSLVNPLEYFKPTAQAISKSPAIKRIIQDILYRNLSNLSRFAGSNSTDYKLIFDKSNTYVI